MTVNKTAAHTVAGVIVDTCISIALRCWTEALLYAYLMQEEILAARLPVSMWLEITRCMPVMSALCRCKSYYLASNFIVRAAYFLRAVL